MIGSLIWAFVFTNCFFSVHGITEIVKEESTQYDSFANQFSEVVVKNNQDSIRAYFRFFDFPLKGKKILDLGCGNGIDLILLQPKEAILQGIDASEEMVRIAKSNVPGAIIKVGFFDRIPFEKHSMDVIISKWAFQTASDIDPIYKEITRVLKPGGTLIFLATHPIRQYIEKKRKAKDYFKKEIVESIFFDGKIVAKEPSHTLSEYLSPVFFENFTLEAYEEGIDSGAEIVDEDIYPSFFIIKAQKKN